MPKTQPPVKLRLWTIEEYHRMAEVGILQPDESVELIAGQIINAQSGIADYWVLNLKNRQLHVFRQQTPDGYQSEVILAEDAIISPLQFPSCTITVSELLPPVIES
ncbi:Uma2 family endonuclease [Coleofasciculus chthonoplastes]|uniref:Uma2 family endonuclease n=1 Tax=Coleofasciculus chthonoplastes TaxID=64178 RepID=UPI0040645207